MKDIKELIYAAVEENAVKFQELVNAQLQVRAYDAIEALRPEIGASMFGESKHQKDDKEMEDDEEEMEDEEDEEMEDEDEMDDKKKSMKEALHPNQQKIDAVNDEKIDAKDFAKLRKMKKGNVQEVAMPKNAADWQAMINHQIKVTGHPVATDAQFRAQHGKDTSKIASLEPGEDKLQYATAQGGTVKQ